VTEEPLGSTRPVLDAVVFTVDGRAVTRGEVRRWAERFDPQFARRVARRAAWTSFSPEDEAALEAEVEEFAAEFRYARGLESADALIRWTEERAISVDDWWESLRISVIERRADGDGAPADPRDGASASEEPDDRVVEADLVVTDLLTHATEALAQRMAVARAADRLPDGSPAGGQASNAEMDSRHDALEASWRTWREGLLDEPRLQRAIERERLAWMVFEFVESHWSSESAAREAVACVREDGLSLEDVARDAGAATVARAAVLGDLGADMRDALVAAAPGEVVGPVAQASHWVVLAVRAKRSPTLAEPLVRRAAERDTESRAVAPLLAAHVRWTEFA